ncbi:MAG: hypothetical protein GXP62_18065 [Oligoflexia bacterium]|nr:hypothetical protein [Oligoflexia bacterium]
MPALAAISSLLLLSSLVSVPAQAALGWTQLSTATGWKEFKTASTKNAGSVRLSNMTLDGVSCFKAEATISGVSAETMLVVSADIEGAKSWSSAGIKDAVTLKRTGSTLDYYEYLSVPLISDRFWFLHGTFVREGTMVGLRWEKAWDGGGPYSDTYQAVVAAHPGAIEPPVNVGAWLFDTQGGVVALTYLVCTDSGGSIPVGLQNMATKGTMPDTVDDLVKEARTR